MIAAMQALLAEWREIEARSSSNLTGFRPADMPQTTIITLTVRLPLSEIRWVEKWLQEHGLGGGATAERGDLDRSPLQ